MATVAVESSGHVMVVWAILLLLLRRGVPREDNELERVEVAGVASKEESRKDGDGCGRGKGTRDGGVGRTIVVAAAMSSLPEILCRRWVLRRSLSSSGVRFLG